MSHYETTVRLTHISTSSKARSGLSVADAVGAAKPTCDTSPATTPPNLVM